MPPFESEKIFRVILILATILLAGCAGSAGVRSDVVLGGDAPHSRAATPAPVATVPSAEIGAAEEPLDRQQPMLMIGTDRQVRLAPARPVSISAGGAVSLKFEQAPVTEVVHAVLGDVLKLNYTLHQPVTGEVTLHTQAPLPPDQLLSLLEAVLQANGLLLVRDAGGLYHVGPPEALRGLSSAPAQVGALPSGYGMVVVPLQFVGAAEMAEILRPIANPDTFVRVDTLRNLLVLAGPRNQIENWLEFVEIFDVDMLKGMSVGMFPLEHVSVQEMAATLRLLTGGAAVDTPPAPAPRAPARRAPAARQRAEAGAGANVEEQVEAQPVPLGPLGGALRILPIERLNAILVVTPRAHFLQQVREWVERFDQPRDGGSEPQLYVYPVQNGTAQHLAGLLTAIFGGTEQAAPVPVDYGVAPRLGMGALGSGGSGTGLGLAGGGTSPVTQALSAAERDSDRGRGGIAQATLAPDVRVVSDDFNNALLIHAPKSEYRKIAAALRRLDLAPTQVLIEASILEVTLTDETRYGIQWMFDQRVGGDHSGRGMLNNRATNEIASLSSGFSYSIFNSAGQLRAVINALAEKSLLNVISSPSVMVLDNHTAAIHVGDQQPVLSSTTITDGGTTTSSIQFKDTGVILSVTPSANSGGMVSMVIRQSVTDVGPVDAATGQRSFLQREVSSRVAVRSGETVVLGGLIRDNNGRDRQGIPLLHDIPLLGALFGTTGNSSVRTELLVMITPRVVRSDQDVRDLGAEMRRRMQGLRVLRGWERFEEAVPDVPEQHGMLPAAAGT
ncbi:type II secretion system secretin GspD [Azoarcus sp. PA01]|nr:type II secretion system secretin GspD [Azoarcus sp. PA01]